MAKTYVTRAVRVTNDGREVQLIEDIEMEIFYVGIEMTTNGKTTNEPNGCRTYYDIDDAYADLDTVCY